LEGEADPRTGIALSGDMLAGTPFTAAPAGQSHHDKLGKKLMGAVKANALSPISAPRLPYFANQNPAILPFPARPKNRKSSLSEPSAFALTAPSRVIRLGFLAPKIIEQILAGEQAIELDARTLLRLHTLPLSWEEQERRFLAR